MSDNKVQVAVDLDSFALDDIADLPEFVTPLSGVYQVMIDKAGGKQIGEHPAAEVGFKIQGVIELSEAPGTGEKTPAVGDAFSTAFMLDNQMGAGKLKAFLQPIAERLGISPNQKGGLKAALEQSVGMQLMLVIKRTYDAKKDKHYGNIKMATVV